MCCIAISNPRIPEKRAYITQHLNAIWGPNFEIMGIDGMVADRAGSGGSDLTQEQIGSALSHLKAYEAVVARKMPWALIVEDDAVLPPDIHDILVRVEATLRRGDVVLLNNRPQRRAAFSTVDAVSIGDYRLCLPMSMGGLGASAAYVITRQAAEGILSANRPVAAAADNWAYFHARQAIARARAMSPNPVSIKAFGSTVTTSETTSGGFMKGSRLFEPLLAARRRLVDARMAGNTVFVNEVSPYANISPQ